MRYFILLPHIKVHNANALSSPYTVGFPAMTSLLGFVHALERKLTFIKAPVNFSGVAVCCHDFRYNAYKGERDFVYSIINTGNPVKKSGERPAFIEEPLCDCNISFIIETSRISAADVEDLKQNIASILNVMKLAGGDIEGFDKPVYWPVDDEELSEVKKFLNKLIPGYFLIDKSELMREAMEEGKDALEALLSFLTVESTCENDAAGKPFWSSHHRAKGWLVPIAVGFQAISPFFECCQQRDLNTPHCFAESIITLGEFIMPYRIKSIDEILWRYEYSNNSLYLCKTNKT